MIICGECGETYRRHQQYNQYRKYYIWVCKRHENTGKQNCPAKPIKEESLKDAFVRVLNGLIKNKTEILDMLQNATVGAISDDCGDALKEMDGKLEILQNEMADMFKAKQTGIITADKYDKESARIQRELDELNLEREEIISEQSKVQLAEYRADAVKSLLGTGKILDEFDKDIFKSLVKQIRVISEKMIEIEFECGIKVRETVK